MKNIIKLYQFQISHYCEKARWALDYKNLNYQTINLTPGLHTLTTIKIAPHSSVPIIVDGNDAIQGSDNIITFLDEKYPKKLLTPEAHKQEVLEWEKYCDEEIGVHLRRYFYAHLLPHKKIVAPLLSQGISPIKRKLFWLMFPKVRQVMRKRMKINSENAVESKNRLQLAIDKLTTHLVDKDFMVGNSFSRADLAAGALLAPIFQPEQYGLNWPKMMPEELTIFRQKNEGKLQKVVDIYQKYR